MIADVVAVKYGRAEFTWGAGKDLVAEGDARVRYLADLSELDANENDVKSLLRIRALVIMAVRDGLPFQ